MATSNQIEIKGRKIGPGYPVYIVAELSANHRRIYIEDIERGTSL
jgi:sialic acid synthase SpsE